MNRKITSALVMGILTVSCTMSHASVNPDPDEIGLYFDTGATTACTTTSPALPFSVYLVITNPTAEEVRGIEFSLCAEVVEGNPGHLFRLGETWYAGFLDLGVVYDWCTDGRAIEFYEPVPRVGEHVVLVMVRYMLLADLTVNFFLGPHPAESIPDGLPGYRDGNGTVLPLHVSSGDPGLPVAQAGGDCAVVPTVDATFGSLKSLYR